ncbi:MAG: WG repeat-containing protein, partial [Bacteroidaceae bacterium]|nr:WG repeat-containing protein [Bacteroidaceae bacterium]
MTPKIDWVRYGSDSIAVYALNGKRGFLNRYTGEIIIDAEKNRYSKAWVFSEGVAAVMKDEMIGFIDPDN